MLAGDVPTGAVKNNFYIEQAEMVRAVGAVSERLHTPNSAREDTLRAVTRALRDRQTVVLSMPLDVQHAPFASNRPPLELPPAPGRLHPDPRAVERLADALAQAKRPLILGGRGAVISGAEEALVALADRVGALLATSVCGHGLFSGNPWSVGISGGFSSPAADELIAESDFILGFGASFTQWTTKKGKLIAPGAVVAQVDIDVPKLGYQMPVQYACTAMRERRPRPCWRSSIGAATAAKPGAAATQCASAFAAGDNHHFPHPDESSTQFIDPRMLSKAVDAILPSDRVRRFGFRSLLRLGAALSARAGRARILPQPFVPVGRSRTSVGHRPCASPIRENFAVLGAGDGGFMMSIADLETAIRLGLRMCILVYNDSSYAAEVHYFGRQGFSVDIVRFPETDFAAIARGYGARGATVRTLADLQPVKAWVAEGAPGVFVIDGKINPNFEADWHAEHFPKDSH